MDVATCFCYRKHLSRPSLEWHDTVRRPQRARAVPCRGESAKATEMVHKRGFLFAHPLKSQAPKSTWFISSRGLLIFSSTRITLPLRNAREIEFSITIKQKLSAAGGRQPDGGWLWWNRPWSCLSPYKQKQEEGSILVRLQEQDSETSIHSEVSKVTNTYSDVMKLRID